MHTKTTLTALFLIATILCTFLVVQPAQAIIGIDDLLLALAIGAIAGAIIGWYIASQYQTVSLVSSVKDQYVNATALAYENLVAQLTQQYKNEKSLFTGLYYYYVRQAEAAAQYYVNESTFPYDKVYAYAGIQDEATVFRANITSELAAIDLVANLYANTTFEGDLADFTVYANTENVTAPYGADLKTLHDTVADNFILDNAYGLNTSGYQWTLTSGISKNNGFFNEGNATSQTIRVVPRSNITATFKCLAYAGQNVTLQALNASGDIESSQTIQRNSETTDETLSVRMGNYTSGKLKILIAENATQTTGIYKVTFHTDASDENDFYYPAITYGNKIVQSYDFANSNHTVVHSVSTLALTGAISELMCTLKGDIQLAMQTAQAYHTYLRSIGYTDVSQIPTLIPFVDLLLPPTNATLYNPTLSGLNATELLAIYAAYMQSLYNLMISPIAHNITQVTFNDINFTSLPVYFTGYVYDNHANVSSGYCSSVWLVPLSHNLTLHINQNNTFTQDVQACWQSNSTGVITYQLMHANDSAYPTAIFVRDSAGITDNASSVTIGITTLDRYGVEYIQGYEGLNIATSTNWSTLFMTLLVPLMLMMMVMNIFDKRRKR